jgi:thymidylate kinase
VAAERVVKIISFSGIDGAGKSTQIHALQSWLEKAGLRVSAFAMWDDVVVGARFRENASRCAFGGDQGVGTPENPLRRRDKNMTWWPLTLVRCFLYFADCVSLYLTAKRLQNKAQYDVAIFDRYIYDELANLPVNNKFVQVFMRFLLRVAPRPDVALLVDAEPEAARARKPEYPVEFLRRNRQAYLALTELAADIVVVHSGPAEDMERAIRVQLRSMFQGPNPDSALVPMRR